MLHLRERIRSLQSTGIDKIWMKVSGNGDFTMANVLGFLDSDLVLLLKTIGLITHLRTKLIILTHGAPGLLGIPMEWNKYKRELWCRFTFESKHQSSPSDNSEALLNQFITAKAMDGRSGARRSALAPNVKDEINQYLAQQPEHSSLSSVGVIPASLSASERSTLIKKATDAADVIEQRLLKRPQRSVRRLLSCNLPQHQQ
jgi:hypothetical protein